MCPYCNGDAEAKCICSEALRCLDRNCRWVSEVRRKVRRKQWYVYSQATGVYKAGTWLRGFWVPATKGEAHREAERLGEGAFLCDASGEPVVDERGGSDVQVVGSE